MNDITALPPVTPEMLASLKLSAMNLAEGEMMSFEPAVFRTLVEALEMAQRQIQAHERAEFTWMNALALPDDASRIDILPAIHAEKYALREATKRIASLESRTVTVKLYGDFQLCHYGTTEEYAKGYIDCQNNFTKWLAAAGIQVIEGEA